MISPRRLFSFSIGLGATNHVLTEPRHYVLFTVWPADINNAANKGLFSIHPLGPNINELWITNIFLTETQSLNLIATLSSGSGSAYHDPYFYNKVIFLFQCWWQLWSDLSYKSNPVSHRASWVEASGNLPLILWGEEKTIRNFTLFSQTNTCFLVRWM